MFSKLRPFIFKLDPELAHTLAIKALKFNFKSIKNIKKNSSIENTLLGKKFFNPIGIAAGFDKDAEVYNSLFKLGFGFVEVGTITPLKQYGNPKPRVFRLEEDEALINRLGFNNSGADKVSSRIILNPPNGLFGINIGPNKDSINRLEDYLICFRKFHKLGDYLTINISSPNTENLRSFHDQKELNELLHAIKEEKDNLQSNTPIAIKISPDIDEKEMSNIIEIINKYNIDGIIISNTTNQNREKLSDSKKNEVGGLSGKPIKDISTNLIKKFHKELNQNITIIGVGGVDSGKSAFEKIVAGASVIQLYTGMIYRGPGIAKEIKKELISILKNEKIRNISEAVGINA